MNASAQATGQNKRQSHWLKALLASSFAIAASVGTASAAEITLIHMGDVHGHLVPRPSLHGHTAASTEGGLARMYTTISEIRAKRTKDKTLLLNTGDTLQGSAEALFTRGGALVEVLNRFDI